MLDNEAELLRAIMESIPPVMQSRCNKLFEKREITGLDAEEQNELCTLINQIEMLNVKRIDLLSQLARLRSVSLDEIIQQVSPMIE